MGRLLYCCSSYRRSWKRGDLCLDYSSQFQGCDETQNLEFRSVSKWYVDCPTFTALVNNNIGSTYLEFDDVEVPVSNLLGQENKGFKIIMSSKFAWSQFFLI